MQLKPLQNQMMGDLHISLLSSCFGYEEGAFLHFSWREVW